MTTSRHSKHGSLNWRANLDNAIENILSGYTGLILGGAVGLVVGIYVMNFAVRWAIKVFANIKENDDES